MLTFAVAAVDQQLILRTRGTGAEAVSAKSIAKLTYVNMSGDAQTDYFSDGITDEILNALAQIPGLKVAARTSAFAFRDKVQDIRGIAEALSVRTILEGSVRRAGDDVRITVQLIDTGWLPPLVAEIRPQADQHLRGRRRNLEGDCRPVAGRARRRSASAARQAGHGDPRRTNCTSKP
jgi:TolB-like protein